MDFAKQKKARLAELEQSFLLAMRQSKFEDALRFAKTAVELDPGAAAARYKDFIPLLEEKVALDESDDEDEEGEGGTAVDGAAQAGEDEDDHDDDESSEEESEEEGEGEEGTEGEDEESDVVSIPDLDSIALDTKGLLMTKEGRTKLREGLRKSIQELKEKELCQKLKDSDPLLGA